MKLLVIVVVCSLLLFASCNKVPPTPISPISNNQINTPACLLVKQVPQLQYNWLLVTPTVSTRQSTCDMFPVSPNNYWIYRDSTFNKFGALIGTRLDTVYYKRAFLASSDSLTFWSKGQFDTTAASQSLRSGIYSTDSAVFTCNQGTLVGGNYLFTKKEYYYPTSDSVMESSYSINDFQFGPRLIKKNMPITVAAGAFKNALFINFVTTGVKTLEYTEYYMPNIGIVKKESKTYQISGPGGATILTTHLKRELIEYSIN